MRSDVRQWHAETREQQWWLAARVPQRAAGTESQHRELRDDTGATADAAGRQAQASGTDGSRCVMHDDAFVRRLDAQGEPSRQVRDSRARH